MANGFPNTNTKRKRVDYACRQTHSLALRACIVAIHKIKFGRVLVKLRDGEDAVGRASRDVALTGAGGTGTSFFWPNVGRLSKWSIADESPRFGESCKRYGLLTGRRQT